MFGFKSHALTPLSQNSNASTALPFALTLGLSHARSRRRGCKRPSLSRLPSRAAALVSRREVHAVSRSPGASAVSLSLARSLARSRSLSHGARISHRRADAPTAHTRHTQSVQRSMASRNRIARKRKTNTHTHAHIHICKGARHTHTQAAAAVAHTHARTHGVMKRRGLAALAPPSSSPCRGVVITPHSVLLSSGSA